MSDKFSVPTAALAPKTGSTATKGKTGVGKVLGWLGSNVFTQENINAGVQIGLTQLNNKSQGKANQIQAQTNQLISQQDDIRNNPNLIGKKGMSTMAWVGIGVGVIALVGIIYCYYMSNKHGDTDLWWKYHMVFHLLIVYNQLI